MSEIESVINYSKRIETLLVSKFQADGRGLHAKLTSIEEQLPENLVKRIRWIATIRNNLVHDENFALESLEDFEKSCNAALEELNTMQGHVVKPNSNLRLTPLEEQKENRSELPPQLHPIETSPPLNSNNASKTRHTTLSNSPRKTYQDNLVGLLIAGFVILVAGVGFWFNKSQMMNWLSRWTAPTVSAQAQTSPELTLAYEDIDSNLFGFIKANTKTWLDQQQLLKNKNGTYDVQVMLHWSVPGEAVGKTLTQYFATDTGTVIKPSQLDFNQNQQSSYYGIAVGKRLNPLGAKPFSKEILEYLSRQQIAIKVSIGPHSKYVIIASGRQCDKTCSEVGHDQYQIHLSNNASVEQLLFDKDDQQSNPVIIKGLTNEDFKNEKSIKTSVEVLPIPQTAASN